jgi:hypothetical protein
MNDDLELKHADGCQCPDCFVTISRLKDLLRRVLLTGCFFNCDGECQGQMSSVLKSDIEKALQ